MGQQQRWRIERDSLGEVRVPADALYGAQTQRAVENFPVSGLRPYPAWIVATAIVKRAAADLRLAAQRANLRFALAGLVRPVVINDRNRLEVLGGNAAS